MKVLVAENDRVMSLYRQVAAHQAELERSNAELAQFASVVSHDLQSPLSSIAGFSRLLQEHYADHLEARATRYITGIMDGGRRPPRWAPRGSRTSCSWPWDSPLYGKDIVS